MTDRELFKMALYTLRHLCLHSRAVQGYNGEQVQAGIDALKARLAQLELPNRFNPDWDAMAVMVEEQQRMAKRIEELTQLVTSQGIRLMDAEAQPEQEPVAWISHNAGLYHGKPDESLNPLPLYTVPPQREWVGLTDDEYFYLQMKIKTPMVSVGDYINAMKIVEEKLKDKNGF